MDKINAVITGVGGYVPDYVLTNDEISKMVDTTDEWIMGRIGIKERHILNEEGLGTSYMARKAAKQLMQRTKSHPDDIDLVIVATTTSDYRFPSTASILCERLGLKNAFAFDMQAVCSGFLYAMETGANFIRSGKYKKIIIVGAVSKGISISGGSAVAIATSDGPSPVMDFVAAGIVLGFSIYEYYKDKIHDNTQTKILSLPRNKKDVVIYRYGGTNPGNLTPSQKDSDTGLSFSTILPRMGGKAAVTTINTLNKTGIVYAYQDKLTHVSVVPVGESIQTWINAGSGSIWTQAVKSVVVKWDGGN